MEKVKYLTMVVFALTVSLVLGFVIKEKYKEYATPIIKFDRQKYDFDTLYRQEDASVYFIFRNNGGAKLKIHKITTSCDCTIAEYNTGYIPVNGIDSLKVTYETANKGHFVKEILVYSNSLHSPEHLSISGFVPFDQ